MAASRIAIAPPQRLRQHVGGHSLLSNPAGTIAAGTPTQLTAMLYRFMGNKSCLKTNKSAAKRFRVRGSGSIKRNKAGMSHNTGYKSNARKRRLASSGGVSGKSIELRMRRLIRA
jgi:large subunit ribosomal protein L35